MYRTPSQKPDSLRFLPSLGDVLFISILSITFVLGGRMLGIDSDLGRHLAIGEFIIQTGSIPTTDFLSHTRAGEPRPPYEWASQVLLAGAYRLGGMSAVILLTGLVIAATFTLLYREAVRRTGLPLLGALLIILAAGASSIHWLPRPHIFTFLFLTLWIILLDRHKGSEWVLIIRASLLMAIWANFHAGFIFGLLAWLAYLAESLWERLLKGGGMVRTMLLVGGCGAVSSIVTPDGWRNWSALLSNNSAHILGGTLETASPNFHEAGMLPFLLLLLLVIVLPPLSKVEIRPAHIFLAAGMAVGALLVARNIPLFAVSAVFILSPCLKALAGSFRRWSDTEARILLIHQRITGHGWKVAFALAVGGGILFAPASYTALNHRFNPGIFPVEAADWIRTNPQQGNMFNAFNWGGYLEYALDPRPPVFLDSQTDFYGEELIREYEQVIKLADGWLDVLDNYDVQWAILPKDWQLAGALQREGWHPVYTDNTAVILKRGEE